MRDPDGVQVPRHCASLLFTCCSALCFAANLYSAVEYRASVWCRRMHTRLIDGILNDALRIVPGCLRPTPTEDLPVLAGIQPAELRRLGATLSLANCAIHNPDHVLRGQLVELQDAHQGKLRSRCPFVPAA